MTWAEWNESKDAYKRAQGGTMKPFNELADSNGTHLKSYVETMQEKAADHGWLSVSLFFNPDEKDDARFHFVSNVENFKDLLMLGTSYVVRAQAMPAPADKEKEIVVVKPGKQGGSGRPGGVK